MGKRLQTVENHVTDIAISTATVDIQVMRIGTKQMTLAVFRQLPRKDILNYTGNLIAPAWGWVNYATDYRGKAFVFSHHGILYVDNVVLELPDYIVRPETELRWHGQTGKWLIEHKEGPYYGKLGWVFESKEAADTHLANRSISAARLKEAPQLFIGV
jgi:hypothetical protein